MEIKQSICAWVDAHEREFFSDLKELIAVNSAKGEAQPGMPYGENCAKVLSVAQKMMKKENFETINHDNYVITADLNEKETELGILAHLDIVPVGDGWSFPALEMTEDEEKVYGRGTSDDKGPALAAFYAMRAVRELGLPLSKNCRLILGADEECGSSDIRHYFASNPVPPKTLSPDAEYPVINIEKGGLHADAGAEWEKENVLPRIGWVDAGIKVNVVPATSKAKVLGMNKAECEAFFAEAEKRTGASFTAEEESDGTVIMSHGVNAHASAPQSGNNALTALNTLLGLMPLKGRAAELIRGLNTIFPHGDFYGAAAGIQQEDEISGKLTITLDMLKVDETSAFTQADCRAPMCANDQNLTDVIRAKYAAIGFAMVDNKMFAPHYVPEDSPLVQQALRVYEEYTGQKGYCMAIGGGTYVHRLEGGVSFGAIFPDVKTNMHGADEFMFKKDLTLTIKMYAQIIFDLCR